jgi:hypothetical protein
VSCREASNPADTGGEIVGGKIKWTDGSPTLLTGKMDNWISSSEPQRVSGGVQAAQVEGEDT